MSCFLKLIISNKKGFKLFIVTILLSVFFITYNIELQQNSHHINHSLRLNINSDGLVRDVANQNKGPILIYNNLKSGLNNKDADFDDPFIMNGFNIETWNRCYNKLKMNHFRFVFCFSILLFIIRRIIIFIQKADGKKSYIHKLTP